MGWGLQGAFFWAVLIWRKQLLGQITRATAGETGDQGGGIGRFASGYAVAHTAGRMWRRHRPGGSAAPGPTASPRRDRPAPTAGAASAPSRTASPSGDHADQPRPAPSPAGSPGSSVAHAEARPAKAADRPASPPADQSAAPQARTAGLDETPRERRTARRGRCRPRDGDGGGERESALRRGLRGDRERLHRDPRPTPQPPPAPRRRLSTTSAPPREREATRDETGSLAARAADLDHDRRRAFAVAATVLLIAAVALSIVADPADRPAGGASEPRPPIVRPESPPTPRPLTDSRRDGRGRAAVPRRLPRTSTRQRAGRARFRGASDRLRRQLAAQPVRVSPAMRRARPRRRAHRRPAIRGRLADRRHGRRRDGRVPDPVVVADRPGGPVVTRVVED